MASSTGETCKSVTSQPRIKELLESWDISRTDSMLEAWSKKEAEAKESKRQAMLLKVQAKQSQLEAAEREHSSAQKSLKFAREELEKRIFEHDMCVQERKMPELLEATLRSIKDQEEAVDIAASRARVAEEALAECRLLLRKERALAEGEEASSDEPLLPGVMINLRELDDVLIKV
jgi:hypothetical protein